jgi:hypothetical protein
MNGADRVMLLGVLLIFLLILLGLVAAFVVG